MAAGRKKQPTQEAIDILFSRTNLKRNVLADGTETVFPETDEAYIERMKKAYRNIYIKRQREDARLKKANVSTGIRSVYKKGSFYGHSGGEVELKTEDRRSSPAVAGSPINHPAHYNSGKIEVIDFIEDQQLDFKTGSAVKYIARAGKKDPAKEVEDLKKAVWYLERKIKNLTK